MAGWLGVSTAVGPLPIDEDRAPTRKRERDDSLAFVIDGELSDSQCKRTRGKSHVSAGYTEDVDMTSDTSSQGEGESSLFVRLPCAPITNPQLVQFFASQYKQFVANKSGQIVAEVDTATCSIWLVTDKDAPDIMNALYCSHGHESRCSRIKRALLRQYLRVTQFQS